LEEAKHTLQKQLSAANYSALIDRFDLFEQEDAFLGSLFLKVYFKELILTEPKEVNCAHKLLSLGLVVTSKAFIESLIESKPSNKILGQEGIVVL
jgi:hypothetical protein